MSKRGLPSAIKMRHDSHYVEEFTKGYKTVGKVLSISQIEPNPEQPRTEIGDLSELSASISLNGVLEPLLVKPVSNNKWMIIAGERRWRAATLAGLEEVPCIELDIDDKTVAEIALIENLQRKDLTIWEEADGLASLIEKFGYTHEDVAKRISKSRSSVTESLSIARLPENIRQRCLESNIRAKSTLLEIARQFDESAMQLFLDKISSQNLKRDEVRQIARPESTPKNKLSVGDRQLNISNTEAKSQNKFSFKGKGGDFSINIVFDNAFDKSDVLKALKEAFESIKANN